MKGIEAKTHAEEKINQTALLHWKDNRKEIKKTLPQIKALTVLTCIFSILYYTI